MMILPIKHQKNMKQKVKNSTPLPIWKRKTQPKCRKKPTKWYTESEDIAILKLNHRLNGYHLTKGLNLWKSMEKHIPGRSFHSLRNRFLKNIRPNLKKRFVGKGGVLDAIARRCLVLEIPSDCQAILEEESSESKSLRILWLSSKRQDWAKAIRGTRTRPLYGSSSPTREIN